LNVHFQGLRFKQPALFPASNCTIRITNLESMELQRIRINESFRQYREGKCSNINSGTLKAIISPHAKPLNNPYMENGTGTKNSFLQHSTSQPKRNQTSSHKANIIFMNSSPSETC